MNQADVHAEHLEERLRFLRAYGLSTQLAVEVRIAELAAGSTVLEAHGVTDETKHRRVVEKLLRECALAPSQVLACLAGMDDFSAARLAAWWFAGTSLTQRRAGIYEIAHAVAAAARIADADPTRENALFLGRMLTLLFVMRGSESHIHANANGMLAGSFHKHLGWGKDSQSALVEIDRRWPHLLCTHTPGRDRHDDWLVTVFLPVLAGTKEDPGFAAPPGLPLTGFTSADLLSTMQLAHHVGAPDDRFRAPAQD
jgi:hypothetical protein